MDKKKPPSLQDIRMGRQRAEFVGREEQLAFFEANLGYDVDDPRRCFVINVHGQGGVGKTWLLRRFQKMAEKAGAITAHTDEANEDVLGVMMHIAEQFDGKGHPLMTFTECYMAYRQRRQEIEADPEMPRGFPVFLKRATTKGRLHQARQVPARSMVADLADEEALASLDEDFASFVRRKANNEDEARLVLEPVETLPPIFLADLRQVAEEHPLALFFDTYERIGQFLDNWLRDLLEGRYGEVPAEIVLVIVGRKALAQDEWAPYEGLVARLSLDPFTKEEASEYLAGKGITDERVVEVILALSGRLPLLVAMLAAQSPEDPESVGDPSGLAVDRFLKWVEDPRQRRVALAAALARSLDCDIVAALLDNPEDAAEVFDWLIDMPFVKERMGGWIYHEVVREQMLRYGWQRNPKRWPGFHGRLAMHYEDLLHAPGAGERLAGRVVPKQSDIAVVHRLLQDAFTDTTLRRFCQERVVFQPILVHFATGFSLAKMIDVLIEYCQTQDLFSELLSGVHDANPRQYTKYSTRLSTVDVSSISLNEARSGPRGTQREQFPWESQGQICYRDEAWQRHALEAMYHRLCQAPWQHLWRVLNRSQFSRAREIEFSLQVAETVCSAGTARGIDALQEWGERRRIGVEAYEADDYPRIMDEWLTPFLSEGELEPSWRVDALASRGWLYMYLMQNDKALDDFAEALALDPDCARALAGRGATYQQMGRYADALSDLNRAVALAPDRMNYVVHLGMAHRSLGEYEAALTSFGRVIRQRPEHAESIANRGWTYLEMRRHDEALADFDRAIELDPDHAEIIAGRAITYRGLGRHDEALVDFDRALALKPDLAWALSNRSDTYRQMDRCEEALADLERALDIDPDLDWVDAFRGMTLWQMRRYEEALIHFDRAIERGPAPAWLITERGKTWLWMGHPQEALADFERAIALEPTDPWRSFHRILAYQVMGHADEVRADLAALIRVFRQKYAENPKGQYLLLDLVLCLLIDGQVEEAARVYAAAPPEVVTPYRTRALVRHLDNLLLLSPDYAGVLPLKTRLEASLQEGDH